MILELVDKRDEAKGTKSFFWKTKTPISYLPGQYYYYTLPNLKYKDSRGPTRHFTLSSSPSEGDILRLTTRIREESGFKKTLDELAIGTQIEGEGPNGTFILDENEKGPQILIAGGIGITPYRSFIKYSVDKQSLAVSNGKGLKTPLYLIYSNSIPEEIAFREELEEWTKTYPNIKVGMTVTKPEESKEKWDGLTGRVDEKMMEKLIKNWKLEIRNSTFWVSGPPPMVDAMEKLLGSLKITTDRLRSEKFTGY